MEKDHKNERVVPYETTVPQQTAEGVVRRIMAYSDNVMCVENKFEKGAVGALHSHPHTQLTYVISGRFRFTIDGTDYEVKAGDTLLKKDGVVHGCVALEAGALLDFFTPMRADFVTINEH